MRTSNLNPPNVTGAPPEETPSSLTALELEEDRRLEVFLNEIVADDSGARSRPELPPDFTARVLQGRPFAPWEVRLARSWKVPAYAAGGLLGAGLAVSLTPLFTLGPGTAVTMWSELLAVSLARPVSVLLEAGPRLAEGFALAMATVPGTSAVLGVPALLSAGALAFVLRRRRSGLTGPGHAGRA